MLSRLRALGSFFSCQAARASVKKERRPQPLVVPDLSEHLQCSCREHQPLNRAQLPRRTGILSLMSALITGAGSLYCAAE